MQSRQQILSGREGVRAPRDRCQDPSYGSAPNTTPPTHVQMHMATHKHKQQSDVQWRLVFPFSPRAMTSDTEGHHHCLACDRTSCHEPAMPLVLWPLVPPLPRAIKRSRLQMPGCSNALLGNQFRWALSAASPSHLASLCSTPPCHGHPHGHGEHGPAHSNLRVMSLIVQAR